MRQLNKNISGNSFTNRILGGNVFQAILGGVSFEFSPVENMWLKQCDVYKRAQSGAVVN